MTQEAVAKFQFCNSLLYISFLKSHITEPVIPEFSIDVTGANMYKEGDLTVYAINHLKPEIEVSVDKNVSKIEIYKVNVTEELLNTINSKEGTYTHEFPENTEDGYYAFRFDTALHKETASGTIEMTIKAVQLLTKEQKKIRLLRKHQKSGKILLRMLTSPTGSTLTWNMYVQWDCSTAPLMAHSRRICQ